MKSSIFLIVLAIVTFYTFSPILKNEFISYDDPKYITQNEYITKLTLKNAYDIFFNQNLDGRAYAPLTLITFAIEYNFAGLNPKIFHFDSLLIHCISTLLFFWLVLLITDGKFFAAFAAALLFGIHPMRVESVAWACERKDVLYGFFYLLSLIYYIKYMNCKLRIANYFLCLLFFQLSILSKGMAVSLPVVLVLVDYLRCRRISLKKNILEKAPFFALSLFWGVYTIIAAQETETIGDTGSSQMFFRLLYASYGFIFYLYRFAVPLNLSLFYPYPPVVDGTLPEIFYAAPIIVAAIAAIAYFSMRKTRVVFFSLSCFLVMVAMVLQFLPVGPVIAADRYTYLSYTGLFFMSGYFFDFLHRKISSDSKALKPLFLLILGVCVFALASLTHQRCKVWKNNITMWNDVLSKYKSTIPFIHRGNYYGRSGEYEKALSDYSMAIGFSPRFPENYLNRGNVFGLQGKHDLAIADFTKAISLKAKYRDAYINRAVSYSQIKQWENALADIEKSISLKPNDYNTYSMRAYTYLNKGDYELAIKDYSLLLGVFPDNEVYYFNRGLSYHKIGEYNNAIKDYSAAIQRNPKYAEAYRNRAIAFESVKNYSAALQDAIAAEKMGQNLGSEYIEKLKNTL